MPQSRSIGEILRDAEAGRLENIFAEEHEPYDLVGSAERLFDLLDERKIDYVLVGGMAMLQYIDGRNTRDVDLIVEPGIVTALPELIVSSEDRDFARADFAGVQLDILENEQRDIRASPLWFHIQGSLREASDRVCYCGRSGNPEVVRIALAL